MSVGVSVTVTVTGAVCQAEPIVAVSSVVEGAETSSVTSKSDEAVLPARSCAVTVSVPRRSSKSYVAAYGAEESSTPPGKATLSMPETASEVAASTS